MKDFNDFGLARPIMAALAAENHVTPTPIQTRAIPALMDGHDLLGLAQTGSGKTAAFALPILHRLSADPGARQPNKKGAAFGPRALVLTPTRELAGQVRERFAVYGARTGLRVGLVIGGAPLGKQKAQLRRGVDILVATPGRLEDLMSQDAVSLDQVEMLVLDEVDQMLDMGFIHAIRRICSAAPKMRQNVFFSATMPKEIARLAQALLNDPVRIEIDRTERPKIAQSVEFMTKAEKPAALLRLVKTEGFDSALVFSRTKHGADRIVKQLAREGEQAQAIHGNRSQGQRERALKAFKRGDIRVLVATDIAARGIDIAGVTHVVNYDLPNVPETYVHRIGRTARAGATGIAVSFCDPEERQHLRAIEKLTGERLNGDQHSRDFKSARGDRAANENGPRKPKRNAKPKRRADNRGTGEKTPGAAVRSAHAGEAAALVAAISETEARTQSRKENSRKGQQDGERRTPRIRRRRRRSAA